MKEGHYQLSADIKVWHHRALKAWCAKKGAKMSVVVDNLIRKFLEGQQVKLEEFQEQTGKEAGK